MGRTTLGIRYPDLDSANLASDVQNTMSDIDALGKAIQTAAAALRTRDGFQLKNGTWTGASGGGTNASFTTAIWDTGVHWAVGSPANLVFDGGWWLVTARANFTASAGNINWAYIRLCNPPASTVMQQGICTGAATTADLEGSVLLYVSSAGLTTALEFAAATSGGANYTCDSYRFTAHRIRTL